MANLVGDETALLARSRQMVRDLEKVLQSDDREFIQEVDRDWDISALQKDT